MQFFDFFVVEKVGLLSRLFRRSTRRKGSAIAGTFGAQYPPTEWFNPRVVHLHSVATQTRAGSPSVMIRNSDISYIVIYKFYVIIITSLGIQKK